MVEDALPGLVRQIGAVRGYDMNFVSNVASTVSTRCMRQFSGGDEDTHAYDVTDYTIQITSSIEGDGEPFEVSVQYGWGGPTGAPSASKQVYEFVRKGAYDHRDDFVISLAAGKTQIPLGAGYGVRDIVTVRSP